MRKTEIERTITFTFDCSDFQEMKKEFESFIYGLQKLNKAELERAEQNLNGWFDKYFDTEYLPCKKCLFLPKEEKI